MGDRTRWHDHIVDSLAMAALASPGVRSAARRGLVWTLGVFWCSGALGCGGGSATPTPTSPSPSTSPAASLPNATNSAFDVAVLVDLQAPPTPTGDIERVMALANTKLVEKTGEQLRVEVIVRDLARGPGVGSMASSFASTRAANPPEGILVLTDDPDAFTYGGYSIYFRPTTGITNEYPSPVPAVGGDKIYVAAVHFDHIYARCGYDDNLNRISDVSVDGECRNRPGTACVQRGSVWMCANALEDLYANHDYFTACTVVHEFLHPFGSEGVYDHYGTSQCIQRTGMSQAEANDLAAFQSNCGLCPDVYGRFRRRSR
jgi:hypothetical protein